MTVFSIFTLQKFTNFHAIRSWSFHDICNEIGWPRFCATLYRLFRSTLYTCNNNNNNNNNEEDPCDPTVFSGY